MVEASDPHDAPSEIDRLSELVITFTHPDDVLHSRHLSAGEKRGILAAWASDLHAVPNLPGMRQIESGAIVPIDTVLSALRDLDALEPASGTTRTVPRFRVRSSFSPSWRRSIRRRRPGGDDDDQPPPCLTAALPPGVELTLRRRRDEAWGAVAA